MPKKGLSIKKSTKSRVVAASKGSGSSKLPSKATAAVKTPKKRGAKPRSQKPAAQDKEIKEKEGAEKDLEKVDVEIDSQAEELNFLIAESTFGDETEETSEDGEDDDDDLPPIEETRPIHQLVEDEIVGFGVGDELEIEDMEDLEIDEDEENIEEADFDIELNKKSNVSDNQKSEGQKAWNCPGCFIKIQPSQFGSPDNPACPSGEYICPAIKKFF